MMDPAVRDEMLTKLDLGQMTVSEALERYKKPDGKPLSERHVTRLLAGFRTRKANPKKAKDVAPDLLKAVEATMKARDSSPTVSGVPAASGAPPEVSPVPPSMSDIDKALANAGGESKPAPDQTVLTADLALQGIRAIKLMAVLGAAELLGITDEKAIMRLSAVSPLTETVIRMQKPESFAAIGNIAGHPAALPVVLFADCALTGFLMYKLLPEKKEEKA